MNATCAAKDAHKPCRLTAVMNQPVPLCEAHQLQVALAVVPDLIERTLRTKAATKEVARDWKTPGELIEQAKRVRIETVARGRHESLVYFVSNGSRVKIGFSRNLYHRLDALCVGRDSTLLLLRGDKDLESSLHARFAACRIKGTEWFELAPDLLRYIGTRLTKAAVPVRQVEHAETTNPITEDDPEGTSEARAALLQALSEIRASGASVVGPRHIWSERKGSVNRSRAWISGQMASLANDGLLVRTDEPGIYSFADSSAGWAP